MITKITSTEAAQIRELDTLALITADLFSDCAYSRFGKPEYHGTRSRAATERLRQLAVKYNVTPSTYVTEQLGKVAAAIIEAR